MVEYYKIKDRKDLIKSAASKAVLNVDNKALDKYREERDKLTKLAQVVEDTERLSREVTEIKRDLGEILELLRKKA